ADLVAAADAFVAHGHTQHSWTYREDALRTYARNYAEASARLSDETARRFEIGDVAVHLVTPDRVDDWLRFFGREGFAGNPDWASCYCRGPHVPAPREQPERPWRDSRAAMAERLRGCVTYGYLAYAQGQPAGWVNASLRSEYGLFRGLDASGPPAASVIGVACFVVAPPFRRHGVAAALLDRVIADAPSRGAAWVEAYPHNQPA